MSKRGPKIGLVLSAGAHKGMAHIGVIKCLEKNKIPIDCIVGTSVGALIGGGYASGVPIKKMEEIGFSVGYRGFLKLLDPTRPSIALIKGDKIQGFISKNLAQKNIEDFKIPFACVATDILTGEKVVFRKGDAATAIRASMSAPVLFKPIAYEDTFLIDGGVVDPLPVEEVIKMGADIIVAVDVINLHKSEERDSGNVEKLGMKDSIVATLRIFEKRIIELTLEKFKDKNIFVITPKSTVSWKNFIKKGRLKEAIKAGEDATEEKIVDIQRMINDWKPD